MKTCNTLDAPYVRLPIDILILSIGLPANAMLLWTLLRNGKALSASEVLGLNLGLLNILYCLCLPMEIYVVHQKRTDHLLLVSEALSALNSFGCPLLLASMCVERYVAASHPVLYLRLGRLGYRVVYTALVWILTIFVALATYLRGLSDMALGASIVIDVLFLVMLVCLVGVVRVLCKKAPGEGRQGAPGCSAMKKRALRNIVAVLVPSTLAYGPLLALAPYLTALRALTKAKVSVTHCDALKLMLVFPGFGVYIGPAFYMSRTSQLLCRRNGAEGKEQTTNCILEQVK
ncbi:lysophosphatidic acid receptor 5 [Chanos chanos]|uniref:Lysophosphatidic acid receptor 5 n=1 Tax=Chanos chanos TaxID=29144 RepID=A0A6J2WRI5_CHACN|nr:lysophosphatidic acid receptor 5-like [Chanos chanos]